jgi:glutathione S-transferase
VVRRFARWGSAPGRQHYADSAGCGIRAQGRAARLPKPARARQSECINPGTENETMLTLYFSPGACSMAAHTVLEEIGKPYEAKPVALRKGQQRTPDYLKINPKGKVPVLAVDGRLLTENPAILSYLGRAFPEAKLWPATSVEQEAEMLSLMAWLSAHVHVAFGRMFGPQRICDMPGSEESTVRIARGETERNFAIIDATLAGKDWAFGSYSVVDPYLFVFHHWAKTRFNIDLSGYPNYRALYERVLARPAVKRMLEKEQSVQKQLEAA